MIKHTVYGESFSDNYFEDVVEEAVRRGLVEYDAEVDMYTMVEPHELGDMDDLRHAMRLQAKDQPATASYIVCGENGERMWADGTPVAPEYPFDDRKDCPWKCKLGDPKCLCVKRT